MDSRIDFQGLDTNSFAGLIGKAGSQCDPVIGSCLQIGPVCIGDGADKRNVVCSGAVDCGIGDGIANLQVLNVTDHLLGTSVMAADAHIAVPGRSGAVMAQSLCHAGIGFALPDLHVNI